MEIVILRHGQTDGNKEGRYLGRTDVPLNETGEAEALASGVLPGVKKVYVSPMIRARRTAELCFPNAAQIVVPDFREMDFGIFEGLNYEEMTGNEEYRKWVDGMCRGKCPGGESMPEFVDRVFASFDAIAREAVAAGEKQLFIAAHGGTVMALFSRCGRPEKDYYDWFVKNGGGYVAHLEEETWASSPVLTEPVPFQTLSALPPERIRV
jgi:alpha-ribazole phosphatase